MIAGWRRGGRAAGGLFGWALKRAGAPGLLAAQDPLVVVLDIVERPLQAGVLVLQAIDVVLELAILGVHRVDMRADLRPRTADSPTNSTMASQRMFIAESTRGPLGQELAGRGRGRRTNGAAFSRCKLVVDLQPFSC